MIQWLDRLRRARTLERRPIPEALWQLTLARYPFLARRPAEALQALREMSTLFLAEKEFSGAGGFIVSDEAATAIAAQACLPALDLGLHWYSGFVGIVVHEDAVVAHRQTLDADGVVHSFDEELSGEAMQGGPVMLAWRDVDEAGESAESGYNVVVHEFAHVLDMRAGLTADDGLPADSERGRWRDALNSDYELFADAVDAGEETFLDPYGAESIEEYFAVASEVFFVAPDELIAEWPATYGLLAAFFRQDPRTT